MENFFTQVDEDKLSPYPQREQNSVLMLQFLPFRSPSSFPNAFNFLHIHLPRITVVPSLRSHDFSYLRPTAFSCLTLSFLRFPIAFHFIFLFFLFSKRSRKAFPIWYLGFFPSSSKSKSHPSIPEHYCVFDRPPSPLFGCGVKSINNPKQNLPRITICTNFHQAST